MAQSHAQSGEVVSLAPYGDRLAAFKTTAILKAEQLELVRLVLPAGRGLREHRAPGEVTVLCLEGRIAFDTPAGQQLLGAGDLIHLRAGEPHALQAIEDASALVTICLIKPD